MTLRGHFKDRAHGMKVITKTQGRRGQAKCTQQHQVYQNDEPRVETCLEDA